MRPFYNPPVRQRDHPVAFGAKRTSTDHPAGLLSVENNPKRTSPTFALQWPGAVPLSKQQVERIRYVLLRREADVRRRDFLSALAGTATGAWPLAVSAQQPAMPVIGFLSSASPGQDAGRLRGFRQGLSGSGYNEGRHGRL